MRPGKKSMIHKNTVKQRGMQRPAAGGVGGVTRRVTFSAPGGGGGSG